MKEDVWTNLICRRFCRYYKPGREEMQCGTYNVLKQHLSPGEVEAYAPPHRVTNRALPEMSADEEIRALGCTGCDFLVDGCDFRQDRSGPPCGGYYILEILLKSRDAFSKS